MALTSLEESSHSLRYTGEDKPSTSGSGGQGLLHLGEGRVLRVDIATPSPHSPVSSQPSTSGSTALSSRDVLAMTVPSSSMPAVRRMQALAAMSPFGPERRLGFALILKRTMSLVDNALGSIDRQFFLLSSSSRERFEVTNPMVIALRDALSQSNEDAFHTLTQSRQMLPGASTLTFGALGADTGSTAMVPFEKGDEDGVEFNTRLEELSQRYEDNKKEWLRIIRAMALNVATRVDKSTGPEGYRAFFQWLKDVKDLQRDINKAANADARQEIATNECLNLVQKIEALAGERDILAGEINGLNDAVKGLKQERDRHLEVIDENSIKMDAYDRICGELSDEILSITNKMRALEKSTAEDKIEKESRLRTLNEALVKKNEEVDQKKAEADALRAEINDAQDHVESTQAQLKKLEADKGALEGSMHAVNRQLAAAQARIGDLQGGVDTLNKVIEQKSDELALKEAELAEANKKLASAEREIEDLKTSVESRKARIEDQSAKIEELKLDLSDRSRLLDSSQAELAEANKKLASAEREIEDLKTSVRMLETQIKQQSDEIEHLNIDASRIEELLKITEEELAAAKERLSTIEKKLESKKEKLESKKEKLSQAKQEIRSLKRTAKKNEKSAQKSNAKINELKDEISVLEEKLDAQNKDLAEAQKAVSTLTTELAKANWAVAYYQKMFRNILVAGASLVAIALMYVLWPMGLRYSAVSAEG